MGFLDNSGDIILDAVLTDTGRKRLARGDGTFKVTKYAFGDDEINYGNYNPKHASGSAYYDLEILQTPILEAFTNNRSSLKTKLMSLTNNNLLFLPVIVLNEVNENSSRPPVTTLGVGSFLVAVDSDTRLMLNSAGAGGDNEGALAGRFIDGTLQGSLGSADYIRCDQGLNTVRLDPTQRISTELMEQQYLIQIDNRLGRVYDIAGGTMGSPAFIDDDQIASYYVSMGVGGKWVQLCATGQLFGVPDAVGGPDTGAEVLLGPRGTKLIFSILASDNLRSSQYLFETMGTTGKIFETNTYNVLDTIIKVTGVTTGYSLDIPVRYVKLANP